MQMGCAESRDGELELTYEWGSSWHPSLIPGRDGVWDDPSGLKDVKLPSRQPSPRLQSNQLQSCGALTLSRDWVSRSSLTKYVGLAGQVAPLELRSRPRYQMVGHWTNSSEES